MTGGILPEDSAHTSGTIISFVIAVFRGPYQGMTGRMSPVSS
jgi:hypothetical protein